MILRKNEGNSFDLLGDRHLIRLNGIETENLVSVIEQTYEPGKGSSIHAHDKDYHLFYVLEGSFNIQVEEIEGDVFEGDIVYIPKKKFHKFVAISTTPARVLVITFPAGLENFFIELKEINDIGEVDLNKIASRYGIIRP